MGNAMTRYPELYEAVVCMVPLLDMKRYTKLLAGASWIAEYGDPDSKEVWDSYLKTTLHSIDCFASQKASTRMLCLLPQLVMTVFTQHTRKMVKDWLNWAIRKLHTTMRISKVGMVAR